MATSDGYIGWAPDNIFGAADQQTKRGDLIAVLLGCSTPVVIRPRGRGGQTFQVIGEAYVQGLMRGEAFGALRTGGSQDLHFARRAS